MVELARLCLRPPEHDIRAVAGIYISQTLTPPAPPTYHPQIHQPPSRIVIIALCLFLFEKLPNIFQPDPGKMPILQLIQKLIEFVQSRKCDKEVMYHLLGRVSLNESLDFVDRHSNKGASAIKTAVQRQKGPGSSDANFIKEKMEGLMELMYPDTKLVKKQASQSWDEGWDAG